MEKVPGTHLKVLQSVPEIYDPPEAGDCCSVDQPGQSANLI